jgi:DNA replication protein DnaC
MSAAWPRPLRLATTTIAPPGREAGAPTALFRLFFTSNRAVAHAVTLKGVVEGIDYPPRRELDKSFIRQLGSCGWVAEHQVVIVSGATGTGKTYVGCALAQQACRKGYRAMYRRASRFFDELRLARADGSYPRLLSRIARVDVLVIDDFAIAPVTETERRDLLEVLEDRYATRATVITSQLPPERWHDYLADPTVADAICDRLLHGAHRIALKGPSRRKDKDGKNT